MCFFIEISSDVSLKSLIERPTGRELSVSESSCSDPTGRLPARKYHSYISNGDCACGIVGGPADDERVFADRKRIQFLLEKATENDHEANILIEWLGGWEPPRPKRKWARPRDFHPHARLWEFDGFDIHTAFAVTWRIVPNGRDMTRNRRSYHHVSRSGR